MQSLDAESSLTLAMLCKQLHLAEQALILASKPYLNRCVHGCHGLCCRNVCLDEIIGLEDFIYILSLVPYLDSRIEKHLEKLKRFFTADCIFLENSTGPCIFPADIRPEICITSFCTDTPDASPEIRAVKWGFQKLAWFIRLKRLKKFFAESLNHKCLFI